MKMTPNGLGTTLAAITSIGLCATAAVAQPRYDLTIVDAFTPNYALRETYLYDINDQGVACGFTTRQGTIGISYSGFVWDPVHEKTVVPVSYPHGINNTGLVVGNLTVYNMITGQSFSPPLLPATYIGPNFADVNDAGVAVGIIQTCNCSNSAGTLQIPYIWDALNGARTVAVPGAKGLGRINNNGVAIGWTGGNSSLDAFFVDLSTGAYTTLNSVFPSDVGVAPTRAFDINDRGTIVGTRQGLGSVYFYGYVYSPGTGTRILPFPPAPYQQAVKPLSVNNAGTIVGELYIGGSSRAFVTSGTGMRDLNDATFVAGIPAGFTLMTAQRINNLGWITGFGNGGGGMTRAYVLRPRIGACVADTDDGSGTGTPDGGVSIDDLLYYLGIFEQGSPSADIDNGSGTGTPDGGVSIDDLLYYLVRFESGC